MSRFLFVVPPLVGHINPTLGVGAELAARGHEVAWAGLPEVLEPLTGGRAAVFPCAGLRLGAGDAVRPPDMRGPGALKFLWERFLVPLAEEMAPGTERAVARFRPDVVVADQQAVAGGLVADRMGVRWATSATTSAEFSGALDGMPKVDAWLEGLLREVRGRIGDPLGTADPRFSPHLVLAFTTEELTGPATGRGGGRIRFVGPSIATRPAEPDFPWDWLDTSRRTVLVSLGTANAGAGERFLAECRAAGRRSAGRLQMVLVDPAADPDPDTTVDRDVLALPYVPQLPLLERADAVVCHAGHNTVCEALWHGVPLVVAPIRDDQPVVAAQVVDAGAGVRVRFGRATASQLCAALDTVLGEPGYRGAAERIGASFRAAGGAPAAAAHLERLAGACAGDHQTTEEAR
ncbi:glycosyltransferase [Streptomyces sp. NPDC048636]|uniref:glycosyltransferase n=1 Tax=Streptomyces sp. NPDC048636 TaxID=3155762 RepID=UPI0034189521